MVKAATPKASFDKRDAVIEALMALAATHPWDEISLPAIAGKAEVSLADLRDLFPSKGAILGGFARKIDRIVLDGTGEDMAGEPTRERVLDVMMRRFDALTPYKDAIREIGRSVSRDPLSLAALNQVALNSWRYMLAAADVDTEGSLGMVRVQGAALVFARATGTWLNDDEPGLPKTMAVVDTELKRGESIMARAEDVHRFTAPLRGMMQAVMERRRPRESRDERKSGDDYAASN